MSNRRPVFRTIDKCRSRVSPRVDFISLQREISESAQFNRILNLKDRELKNRGLKERITGEAFLAANNVLTEAPRTVISTPVLRLGFSIDHSAY